MRKNVVRGRKPRAGEIWETLISLFMLFLMIYGAVCLVFSVVALAGSSASAEEAEPQTQQTEQRISPEVFPTETAAEPAPGERQPEAEPLPEPPQPVSLGDFIVTAYCACEKCCGKSEDDPWYGITATGTRATEGRTIAVDPAVIALGSVVYFQGMDGLETGFIAEDTGGAIRGDRIDLYFDSHADALKWGVREREVFAMVGQ